MNESKEISVLKSKIENRLQRIANVLLLNASFIDNLGLLNGKMGIAIFFYHYSRYTGNKIFEDYAGELIDEIYEEINTNTPVDFANGFTGIGWGIEYLVKNRFIEADTDEVLEAIDKAVHQSYLNSPYLLENGNDVFGYGFYYLSRLKRQTTNDEIINELIKKQHLIYMTDECERILINKRYLDFNSVILSTATVNSLSWFLLEMHKLELFPSKTEKLIKCLPDYMTFIHPEKEEWTDMYILKWMADNFVRSTFDPKFQGQFHSISNSINAEFNTSCEGYSCLNTLAMLTSKRLIFGIEPESEPLDYKLFERAFKAIENEEIFSRLMINLNLENLGLSGLSGIGLSLIQYIGILVTSQKPTLVLEKSNLIE